MKTVKIFSKGSDPLYHDEYYLPVGTRYLVDHFGCLCTRDGDWIKGEGSHSYEYTIEEVKFEQIDDQCFVSFVASAPYSSDIQERIQFEENSDRFAKLDIEEYKEILLKYVFSERSNEFRRLEKHKIEAYKWEVYHR